MDGGEGGVAVHLPARLLRRREGQPVIPADEPTVPVPTHPAAGTQRCKRKRK